ncbi:MAG TPA: GH92 family glycosyl hydrolase [Polyangia bacterium]|nr:GH92 family glycosyl hydrolase [Polyangia bacterium]
MATTKRAKRRATIGVAVVVAIGLGGCVAHLKSASDMAAAAGGAKNRGGAASSPRGPLPDVTRYVDPFIGTSDAPSVVNPVGGGGGGSDFPGAAVPFGMVQLSPDTPHASPSGYGYESTAITGFSMTHFSGAGCANMGDLPMLPLVDPTQPTFPYQHANEHAAPGYYDVTSNDGLRVELTATARSGAMRLTFPANAHARVIFDASRSQTSASIGGATITANAGGDGLVGTTTGGRFCGVGSYPVYFAIGFDRAWQTSSVSNGKATLGFDTSTNAVVNIKVGLSYVSEANAQANLAAENPGWSFDTIRDRAKTEWNTRLNAIGVAGGAPDDLTKLYTALYHSLLHPNVYSDVGGDYMGFDKAKHTVAAGHVQYASFSGWDIYRSQVQLMALLFPDSWNDVVQSLVNDAQQCGAYPKWSAENGEDNIMIGDPGSMIVANSYAFGATGFDRKTALAIMRKMTLDASAACNGTVELPALSPYESVGFSPGRPSETLEMAARDAAVARFAAAAGDADLARITAARSAAWRNQLNPATTPAPTTQPRNRDGSFVAPIAPAGGWNAGFTEGSVEQYTWYVPQDPRSLFDALGGDAAVVTRLDAFFTTLNAGQSSANCYLGNEPDFSTPFLYDWAGAPWRTQDVVHRALTEAFSTAPGGMPGNDDLGATSSLAVWLMLGLYPEVPGVGGLAIASPAFSGITMHLGNGKTLQINASGLPGHYIQSATLNGAATTSLWLPASTILAGATLDFVLGAAPSTWGGAPADAPPSFGPGTFATPGAAYDSRGISPNATPTAGNFDGVGFSYSQEAIAGAGVSGATFTFANVTFPWPAAGSTLDNIVVAGQTLTFTAGQTGGRIAWLGAADEGPASGSGTLHYTDGTSTPFTLTFGDWTLGGGVVGVSAGNRIALTTKTRNNPVGVQTLNTYVFYASTPLDATRTIANVTLPGQVSAGQIHLFSYALTP